MGCELRPAGALLLLRTHWGREVAVAKLRGHMGPEGGSRLALKSILGGKG